MTTDPLDRFERLFRAAQMHPPEERVAFLDAACADDLKLRRELESLLQADDEADEEAFLDEPAAEWAVEDLAAEPDERAEGQSVGPYVILRPLGRGGMGDVYLAVRHQPFKRYVALKIVRRGMDTREILLRFEMERQILASLNHPNVARLLDGGVTDNGLPYFAMEYVEGLPLTRYCDAHRLDVDERLRLFQTVCRAVQYAHQNLVIHRDLKPSNILVTQDGTVKLLDFGIAKLLNPNLSPLAMPVTRTEVRRMTPEYASPEQVRGETLTTASDVYALGVILYELLTGHRPYRLTKRTTMEIAQVVCKQDPERPSTKVIQHESITHGDGTTKEITPATVSEARAVTIERLRRRLRGDLDNIVLMAMRKEPSRRYGSAEQFGHDLEGYLAGQPVVAHRDTRAYRLKKFVGRRRIETLAAAIIAVLLVGFSLFTALQSRTVVRERDQKELEARKAAQVTAFLLSLFETADPHTAPGDTMIVRDVLEAGAARVATELAEQPEVQAEMLDVIGQAYQNLGRYDRAAPFFEQSLTLRRDLFGYEQEEVARSVKNLAALMEDNQNFDRAESLYREYLALQRALHGDAHPEVHLGLYRLWSILHMKGEAADSLFEVVLTMQGELPEMDDPVRARTMAEIASALSHMGRYEEAEGLTRSALAMARRLYGDQHPQVAELLNQVAQVLNRQQRYAAAESAARQAVALYQALYPEGHSRVVSSLERLSDALRGQDREAEAEALFQQALASIRALDGSHPILVAAYGKPLAQLLYERGLYDEAEDLYREIGALYERRLGSNDLQTVEMRERLGDVLRSKGQYVEAERLLLDSYHLLRAQQGEHNLYTKFALRRLAELYEAWGRPEEAARYRTLQTP